VPDNETFIDLFPDADPEATARPTHSGDSLDPVQVLARLPRWQDDDLEMRRTLGEGGMGIVRLAHQPALGRDVAVKTLRRSHRTEGARWQVLQEAWAAGSLEHPNIVPVYSLGLDEADMPYIVLKRLEGERWTDRLRRDDMTVADHLRVLEGVATAVAYAHDRGVLHRDLKPDNVMIGSYDEVTVIDWGLAVTTEDAPERRLPRARDQHQPAGTPAYMAPEQLAEGGARPVRQTDVYLLGGLLYRILHGRSPHGRGKLPAVIGAVRAGLPPLDPDLDPEARALLTRAMATDPAARHPDAGAFLRDLRAYQTHRGARALLAEADRHADALVAELQRTSPSQDVIQQELGACRFGYQQAQRAWAEAPVHRLDEVLVRVARHHLSRGEPGAAAVVAAGLSDAALHQEIAAARASREARRLEAERLRDDLSAATGVRTRTFLFAVVGGLWVVGPLIGAAMPDDNDPAVEYVVAHVLNLLMLALVTGLALWARDSLGRSQINRYLRGQLFGICLVQALALAVGQAIGHSVNEAVAAMLLAWLGMSVCNVALVGRVLLPMAVAFAAAYTVAAFVPDWSLAALAGANVVLLINTLAPWMPLVYDDDDR